MAKTMFKIFFITSFFFFDDNFDRLTAMVSVNLCGKFDPTKYNQVITDIQLKILQTKINSIIIETLLGDGCIAQPKKGKPYYKYKQSIVHAEYLAFYFIFLNLG